MLKFDFQTDLTWMMKISFKLDKFKKASATSHVYNARCPICGDSEKSQSLARLYFYEKGYQLNVFCHNCGYSHAFYNFMKDAFPVEFQEYKKDQLLERFKRTPKQRKSEPDASHTTEENVADTEAEKGSSTLKGCVPIMTLDDDHDAVKYLKGRSFGDRQLERLWYTDDFSVVANDLSCEELSENFPSDARIVIPFYNTDGLVEMVQGRSLNPKSKLRYISIKTSSEVDKIYGKYELDESRTSYCTEGPFDSLFVENCIATCDSNLLRSDADVLIFDNQPRSREIVNLMEQAIKDKRSLVVWPTSPDYKQDINDLIKLGLTPDELMDIIRARTFNGLKAKLELNSWRRI